MMKQKAKADESLLEALPAVEAAARALDNLDRNDLTELKAFSNPHPAVKSICMMLVCLRPTGDVRATLSCTVLLWCATLCLFCSTLNIYSLLLLTSFSDIKNVYLGSAHTFFSQISSIFIFSLTHPYHCIQLFHTHTHTNNT